MMQAQEVKVRRGMDQKLRAENYVPMHGGEEGRCLKVSTSKFGKELVTSVTSVIKTDGGFTWEPFSDFTRTVARNRVRATAGTIEAQQRDVLNIVDDLVAEAESFYAAKEKADNVTQGDLL